MFNYPKLHVKLFHNLINFELTFFKLFPSWCTISGDSDWATYCGEQPLNSASGFLMPMFVIVGIVISGVVLVVCIVAAAFCLFHRGAKKKPPAIPTGIWKEVPTRPDAEDGELLNDYD